MHSEVCLKNRSIIHVTGKEAFGFLQNILTNDLSRLTEGGMQYNCLLSPQGQVLHDLFVFQEIDGFMLDVAAFSRQDLLRRLNMYRLRSQVTLTPRDDLAVYVGGTKGSLDPRYEKLGRRHYAEIDKTVVQDDVYTDLCLSLGIPTTEALQLGKDFPFEGNLDLLSALSFDKGCFVGQEVAVRIYRRGLIKRRLYIVKGEDLAVGDLLLQNGKTAGEIRALMTSGKQGIAVTKCEALQNKDTIDIAEKGSIQVFIPPYLHSF